MRKKQATDPWLRARSNELRQGTCAREAPRALFMFVGIIVLFDTGYALVGIVPPLGYFVSDAIQCLYSLTIAALISRGTIPVRLAPAAFASAIVVNNFVMNYQYRIVGYIAIGVILLLMTAYGAIALMWRPFLISAAIMAVTTASVLDSTDPEQGPAWTITALTALGVSAVLLYGRGHSMLELAQASRTIQEMATRDALTGLLNRHGLEEATPLLTSIARRSHEPVFAVFIDIAGLKAVNDAHGHRTGDLVISRTAAAVAAQSRDSDLVCRWGGDEFIVLGVGPEPDADDLTERIAGATDTEGLEGRWTPRVCVGTASLDQLDVDALISQADGAMYARRNGG